MPNGEYGRYLPRFALAVADFRARFGEWPTHARGRMVRVLIRPPDAQSDSDDHVEYSVDLAERVKGRLLCDAEDETTLIELSGPSGRSEGYGGFVVWGSAEARSAYNWLYGRDPGP